MKRIIYLIIIVSLVIIFVILKPDKFYYAENFGIKVIKSNHDKNNNGIDDFTDIMLGARIDAENKVKYKSAYYAGGYPPENVGVCADLVWRSLAHAGYDLKEMMDEDIKNNIADYPGLDKNPDPKPDPNIDFRRVRNQKVFFEKYAESLTLDLTKIEEWQPGDIVVFGKNYTHIGIISDKRNKKGIPYLIHNSGQWWKREEDVLEKLEKKNGITGHYRYIGG